MVRDGSKWEGCDKWRDVGKVGVPVRLGLKLTGGLTGACFRIRAAVHLHWSDEVFGIRDHKDDAAELQLSQLFCTCLVCPCLITIWSTARRSDSFSSTETVYGALRGHSSFLPHLGKEREGEKCWTNLWAQAKVRDGAVGSQPRKCCLLADPTCFLIFATVLFFRILPSRLQGCMLTYLHCVMEASGNSVRHLPNELLGLLALTFSCSVLPVPSGWWYHSLSRGRKVGEALERNHSPIGKSSKYFPCIGLFI